MSLSFDNSEAGCMLFYDCHRSVPAPFLTKTYHLVNDPSTDEIVSWGEDHTTFVVWRPPEFARDLLPNYFKHNNFSSFVRQLNTYGFRKVVPDRWEFANDFFRRGERHLLCEIHRRKALQPASGSGAQQSRSLSPSTSIEDQAWGSPISSPLPSPIPMHIVVPAAAAAAAPPPPPPQLQQQHYPSTTATPMTTPLSISDENERLRKDNTLLLSEVSRLRRLYEETINMIQHQFKGSSPDHFTTLISSTRIGAAGQCLLDRAFQPAVVMGPAAAAAAATRRELENRELSVHVRQAGPGTHPEFFCKNSPAANYSPFQDHNIPLQQQQQQQQQQLNGDSKLRGSSSNSTPELPEVKHPLPVKLFGVPLHSQGNNNNYLEQPAELRQDIPLAGTKRRQPEPWSELHPHDRVFLRPPPRKCLQGSSEMGSELSRPASVQAPWLQICATRDEGVYI